MLDQRNMIVAIVVSAAILFGWQFFIEGPRQESIRAEQEAAAARQMPAGGVPGQPVADAGGIPAPLTAPSNDGLSVPQPGNLGAAPMAALEASADARAGAIESDPRVTIDAPRVRGSINLKGGLIDDLTLTDYFEELGPDSPEIVMLSPSGTEHGYFANFGFTGLNAPQGTFPDMNTVWTADRSSLSPGTPVVLSWENGMGQIFRLIYEVDENFLITVNQEIENFSSNALQAYTYGLIKRTGHPEVTGFYILHEGLLGVLDDSLEEIDYDDGDLVDTGSIRYTSKGGWLGITDKYWLAALIPDQSLDMTASFSRVVSNSRENFQSDFLSDAVSVNPRMTYSVTHRLFAGAKEVEILDSYEANFGIDKFDLAIDWGWFYFLTKPLFWLIAFFYDLTANFGIAIFLLTVVIKLAFFPLANKSYVAMSKMRKLQPEQARIKETYADDRVKQQEEIMALFKKESVNPASGCLPMLIQIPVFFALYKVLFVTIEMRHEPFFGWIQDLAAPDPSNIFTLFGMIPWDPPGFMALGAWPLIMGVSMWAQMKLNPQPADPLQAKMFMLMPIVFTFILAGFPAGLVIYWTCNNVLSMAQQWLIMRRADKADALKSAT